MADDDDGSGSDTPVIPPRGDVPNLIDAESIGPYRLIRYIAKGGMGKVYEAQHTQTGQVVALKLMSGDGVQSLTRFKKEYRQTESFSHPNIVRLYDLQGDSRSAYFTMELLNGRHFDKWVRGRTPKGELPNLFRLHRGMRQLIAGVEWLHGQAFVHRDLKPSNVMVTGEGRVVILDFGLIRETQSGLPHLTLEGQFVGTVYYTAPEQAEPKAKVHLEADWYSVGVILYKCLSGRLPFEGNPLQVLMDKQVKDPPDLRDLRDLPEDLHRLCMRLLARAPADRPTASELLRAFSPVPTSMPPQVPIFVGRERELDDLHAGLAEVQTGPVVVRLVAASGFGKSTLVRQFFKELDDDVVKLRCRCIEREFTLYKGIDGIVDMLASLIRKLPKAEANELRPEHLAALARIFPVLADVWDDAYSMLEVEPVELRRMGARALREVLRKLSSSRRLVLAIDDFQWSDVDSFRLLQEIFRLPDPPRLLLIIGQVDGSTSDVLELLDQPDAFAGVSIHEHQLGPLSPNEARQLALDSDERLTAEQLEQVVRLSQGNPLLARQLARPHVEIEGAADRMIVGQVLALPREQRRLLEQIAVASIPLSRAIIDALATEATAEPSLVALVEASLIRREHGEAGEERIEIAHELIRELVVSELAVDQLARRHRQLAAVLEQHGAEPETIADHWELGRRPAFADHWAEEAARKAAAMLAFARAAAAYRRAIRVLGGLKMGPVDELRYELAEQLIALGEIREAIELLMELAGRTGPEEASGLRRRIAWLLLEDGRIEQAIPLIAELLEDVGEALPEQRWRIVLGLISSRVIVALRGLDFEVRTRDAIAPEELARIDTLNTFVTSLSQYGHHPRAALITSALRARVLRLALAAGEPSRIAYSLAHEGLINAAAGRTEYGDQLVARGCALLEASEGDPTRADPTLKIRVRHIEAMLYFMTGRWPEASTKIDALVEQTEHAASGWLRPQLLARRAQLWLVQGRFTELRLSLASELPAMRERKNIYTLARLVVVDAELCAFEGEITEATERLQRFRTSWPTSLHTFETIWLDMAGVNLALFRSETDEALELTDAAITAAREHQVGRILMMRLYFDNLLVRVLGQALLAKPADFGSRGRFRRTIRSLRRSGKPMFVGMAACSQALLHELDEDERAAQLAWRAGLVQFEQCGMAARVAAVQLRIPELAEQGVAYFERERVTGWKRFVEVYAASRRPVA